MSDTAHVQANRRTRVEAVRAEQKAIRGKALDALARDLEHLRERRRHVLTTVRAGCKRSRERLREFVKTRRALARAEINAEIDRLRAADRQKCAARRAKVNVTAQSEAARKRRELRLQHRFERGADVPSEA